MVLHDILFQLLNDSVNDWLVVAVLETATIGKHTHGQGDLSQMI